VAPDNWRGALGFTYHIGPGPATVHFKIDFDNSTRPLHDVIATIPGSAYPDQWVIYGNHHDGWVNGAHDPISGAASLLETAETLLAYGRTRRGGRGDTPAEEPPPPPGFHLGALGAGSDYVAFIDHLGVASLNLGFGGQNLGGVYHSIYDDPQWFEQFADPGF